MAYVDWMLEVRKIAVCNCDYGCPCEFMAPPTHGHCEGVEANQIVKGHFADIRLDGLCFGGVFHWPGAVHEGGGSFQSVIDSRADKAQLDALFTILSGKEQEPTTLFNIYGATIDIQPQPIFAEIEFEFDIENGVGRFAVPDVMEANVGPIRNPATGEPFRAQIKLPKGFEYREAEMVSADFWGKGEIAHEHEKRFGYLTYAAYGPYGVIEEKCYRSAAA